MEENEDPNRDWETGWISFVAAAWRPVVVFELLFGVLVAAVFVPMAAWFTRAILAWGGNDAVSNFELAAFFLSVPGMLFLFASATLGFALLFFEIGGITVISLSVFGGQRPAPTRVIAFLCAAFPRLFRLGLRQFGILFLWALPFLGLVLLIKATMLGGADIYYYLSERPPVFRWALALSGIAALAYAAIAAVLLVRWIFSLPALLVEGLSAGGSIRRSKELVVGRRKVILINLAKWALFVVALSALGAGVFWAVQSLAFWWVGESARGVLTAASLLVVINLLVGAVVSLAASVVLAALIAKLFCDAGGKAAVSGDLKTMGLKGKWYLLWLVGTTAAFFWGAFAVSSEILETVEMEDAVGVTAHRGSALHAPENTLAAIERAIEDGADFAEIDVQETADGEIVLLHDKDLWRVAGVRKNIWEMSLAELKELDVGSWFGKEFEGERIPTLEEVIEGSRGKIRLNIELKFNGHEKRLAESVADIVRRTNFEDECFLSTLSGPGLEAVRKYDPGLRTGLIVSVKVGDATRLDTDVLAVNANTVDRDLIRRAHLAGKEVHVWSLKDPAQMNTMIHLGVDNILTDRPDVLVALLEERKKLSKTERIVLLMGDFLSGRL